MSFQISDAWLRLNAAPPFSHAGVERRHFFGAAKGSASSAPCLCARFMSSGIQAAPAGRPHLTRKIPPASLPGSALSDAEFFVSFSPGGRNAEIVAFLSLT